MFRLYGRATKAAVLALVFLVLSLVASGPAVASPATTSRVSVSSAGVQGTGITFSAVDISADGRFVGYMSSAPNLVEDDTNNRIDMFVHDRQTGTTERVSVDSSGQQGNEGPGSGNDGPALNSDGRFVAFLWGDLLPGDNNGHEDVLVRDRQTGQTELISRGYSGAQSDGRSGVPSISADGRFVTFDSWATNLVPEDNNVCTPPPFPENCFDVFVHDRVSGETSLISVNDAGEQGNWGAGSPMISAGGRYVVYESYSANLVPHDTNNSTDVFLYDRATSTVKRVSVGIGGVEGNSNSWAPSISSDGRTIVFYSNASNFAPDDPPDPDIFTHDVLTGVTRRVARAVQGDPGRPDISESGRFIAYSADDDPSSGDTNLFRDYHVLDLISGAKVVGSKTYDDVYGNSNSAGMNSALSADGRLLAFVSTATNLVAGDTNNACPIYGGNCPDAFVRDLGDSDDDGYWELLDNCPSIANPAQTDTDSDDTGDACDTDDDNDTVIDLADNCPTVANTAGQAFDVDGDLAGDACDGPGSGNVDCNGTVNSIDALKLLRFSAGLSAAQNEPCLDIGLPRTLAPPDNWKMGDVDCSGEVNSIDALAVLRAVAGLSVALPAGCPTVKPP